MTDKEIGYSDSVRDEVVSSFDSGRKTVSQITKAFGVSESTVYRWVKLDRQGLLHSRGRVGLSKGSRRKGKLSCDDVNAIVEMYRDNNMGTRVIAQKFGVRQMSIKYILEREGVYKGLRGASERKSKLPPDKFNELTELYTTTHIPLAELASKFGVTEMYIKGFANHYKLRRPSGQKAQRTTSAKYQLSEQVTADYKTGEYTHKVLAEKYGVSTRTISRILDSAGIEAIGGKKLASATEVAGKMDDVVSLADQGKGVFDIAADTGMSVGTVKHILENNKREKKRAEDTLNARIAELHSQGLILKDIAKEADMSVYLVKKILEELGLEHNSPSDKHRPCVVELCKQGMSADSIASQVGLSVPTVRKILHEEGLTPSKGDNEVKKRVLELFNQGMNAPQIASECGISAPTVRKIIATSGQVKGLNERIVELYDGGMEIEQIAQEVGLNRPLVMIELSKAMKAVTLYRPFFPESDISVIKHLASKWTTPDKIALHLGCDENYIRRFLQLPDKKI